MKFEVSIYFFFFFVFFSLSSLVFQSRSYLTDQSQMVINLTTKKLNLGEKNLEWPKKSTVKLLGEL